MASCLYLYKTKTLDLLSPTLLRLLRLLSSYNLFKVMWGKETSNNWITHEIPCQIFANFWICCTEAASLFHIQSWRISTHLLQDQCVGQLTLVCLLHFAACGSENLVLTFDIYIYIYLYSISKYNSHRSFGWWPLKCCLQALDHRVLQEPLNHTLEILRTEPNATSHAPT